MVTPDTPYIHYCDDVVYFCEQDCKQMYDDDPLNSCMAARLLSGK
jgi:YHS domain-containing protein